MKYTNLYPIYKKYGAKTVDFYGWSLPLQFNDIIEEHNNVREKAGIFDVSHMGEILIEGNGSNNFINTIITNDVNSINNNRIIYSPMCYENGGTIDDILIYKFNNSKFLLIVNASNIEKDYTWLSQNCKSDINITNCSDKYSQIALQGPYAQNILSKLTNYNVDSMIFFEFNEIILGHEKLLLSRSGYTGEDGFELYMANDKSIDIWEKIIEAGKEFGIMPCGLGARNTLRLEACLPLYGHELTEHITPIEAGLSRFVKFDKGYFIGKEYLLKNKNPQKKIVGFQMIDKGIAREGFKIYDGQREIGIVTSGSYSPTLMKNLGLAIIESKCSNIGKQVDILIRNKRKKAKIVKTPFYNKKYRKT